MKFEGWESNLDRFLQTSSQITFEWGESDCALWCAAWVLQATGKDFAGEWRGKYASLEELTSLMQQKGFERFDQIADHYGRQVHVNFAQRGDIVMNKQGCLGICNGRMSHFLTFEGLTKSSTFECLKAWKVD